MGGWGGLIELVLVLCCLLGWGAVELRGARLDKKKAEEAAKTGGRDNERKG